MSNKEIVQAWIEAIQREDYKALKNLMDSNFQFRNPFAQDPIGSNEYIAIIQMMHSAFEGEMHNLEAMIAEGEYVAISGIWSAKHTGEFNEMLASGNLIEVHFVEMFYLLNGKIVNANLQFNPMSIIQQMNVAE